MGIITDDQTAHLIRTAKLAQIDAGREWDHLAMFYATMREHYSGNPSLSFGTGETVPPSYVQMRGRAVFFQALHRLVPESTSALLTEEAYEIVDGVSLALRKWGGWIRGKAFIDDEIDPVAAFQYPPLAAALEREAAHIQRWQDAHNLPDEWIANAARFTMNAAAAMRWERRIYDFPVSVADPNITVHDGKERPNGHVADMEAAKRGVFRWTPAYKLVNVPVYLDDLKHAPIELEEGYELEDEGELGTFDPRQQTIEEAVKAFLPALTSRLRHALEAIRDEDQQENGTVRPITFRKATRFERLIRYQVLGHSLSQIAREDDADRKTLREERDATAALIGLTLRDRDKGGRPRKPSM